MIYRSGARLAFALLGFLPLAASPQNNLTASSASYTEKIPDWKKLFPKEDAVASTHKQTVDFFLNTNPKPGEGRVKASVQNEVTLVPLKDYIKYEDGIFYYDEVSIDNLKVLNSEGKDVKAEKLCGAYQEESIFHSDSRLCVLRFQMADKGKAFKVAYQSNYRDVKYLTSFYFHDHIPSAERIVQFNIPSWMELDLREFNFAGYSMEKSSVKEGDITKVTFRLKDVPAYTSEPHSPNHAITYPHLVLVSKAFTEGGARNTLFESVKDLYGWYSSVCADIGNKPEELKAKVSELTFNKKTDIEKIESIFYWVQDNIRYIAFENGIMGFRPDAAQNVYNKKYGDCKGKANLLREMLKLAGYDARLTWIGTSDLPYDYSLPALTVDNHMICTVILNGKRYFLDGTEDYIALNDYAQRIQGKQVLIEDGKNYIIDKVPQFPADRNKEKKLTKVAIDGVQLSGSSTVEYNGESKIMAQRVYASIRNDDKKDALSGFLRNGDDNIKVSNIKNSDFNDRQKPLQLSFDFKAEHQVTKAGDELYVVMDWEKEFSSLEIPADRKNDYEFNQKYYLTTQTELALPEGYKVDYLPAAFKKSSPNYSFEGSYVNKGKSIVYTKTITISKPILKKSEFAEWNSFIAEINKFYNDQVVLKK
ncbi:MAG TPA: transglutaminase domain-containing protein [Flavisolibacter sp.]|jgi:transglutaminase-like putative cysteine protease